MAFPLVYLGWAYIFWTPLLLSDTSVWELQIYNRTGRSILAVLVFHAMMNFTGEWLRISPDMYPFMLAGNAMAALLIVLWWHFVERRAD